MKKYYYSIAALVLFFLAISLCLGIILSPYFAFLMVIPCSVVGYFVYIVFFKRIKCKPVRQGKIAKKVFDKFYMAQHHDINQKVVVKVYCPKGYDTQQLPVVYVLDGDHLFYPTASYAEQQLLSTGKACIVVGIGYGYPNPYFASDKVDNPKGRWRDFLFQNDSQMDYRGKSTLGTPYVRGDRFYDFLLHDVSSYVVSQYGALPVRGTLIGHSYGGGFCSIAQTKHTFDGKCPFDKYVIADGGFQQYYNTLVDDFFNRAKDSSIPIDVSILRIWGEKVNIADVPNQEGYHQNIINQKIKGLHSFRYFPLNANHSDTQLISIENGVNLALGLPFSQYEEGYMLSQGEVVSGVKEVC